MVNLTLEPHHEITNSDILSFQYRAMFVMNCTIDYSEKLTFPKPSEKNKKKGKKNESQNFGADNEEELFNPVKCSKCSTQVAVYDADEIFHFFNVVASHT